MNIKKMGRLLSMCAFASVAGLSAKADESEPDVMEDIFGQERLAVLSTNGVVVSFANGYHWIQTNDNQVVTNYYPVLVESEDGQKGFAVAHTNMPELADIAVDRTSGRIFASKTGANTFLYELGLSEVSSNQMMTGRIQFQKQDCVKKMEDDLGVTEVPENVVANKLVAFNGEWIMTFQPPSTTVNLFHVNGNINFREAFESSVDNPKYICESADAIYISDGENTDRYVKNGREIPPTQETGVYSDVTGIVGMASVGTDLYQATTNTVYKNGKECVFSVTTTALTGETRVFNRIADLASDGQNLYLSHEGNVSGEKLTFSGTSNIVYVSDAPQLISSQNTVYKKVGNQLQKIKE